MGLFLPTDWKYDTSQEKAGSFLLGLAIGKMWFVNSKTGERLALKYRAVSLNLGAGPPVQASWSHAADPSHGVGNVTAASGKYFGSLSFPCRGYVLSLSGTVGLLAEQHQGTGALTMILFGLDPVFAGVRIVGSGHAVFPGAGAGGGVAVFEHA